MSIKEYKKAFSGIEPSQEMREKLVDQILREERQRKRRTIRPGVLAACAAVMVLCLSATAVAAFDLNDIFHGFFKRQATEQADSLEMNDAFLASAGNVIHEETSGNGLRLTARGTVSDGNALYAAIDVETEDGSPFTSEQEGKVNSLRFEDVKLTGDGIDLRYCGLTRIDDGSQQGKATFLLSETFEEDLQGKTIRLDLSNLMMESSQVIDLCMEKSVWELMQEFEPLTEETVYCDMSGEERDEEGNVDYYESFSSAKTQKRVAFSDTYPEAALSNLGVWEGAYSTYLLANLEFGGAWDNDLSDQKNLLLVDRRTGQEISDTAFQSAIGNGAEESYFPGLTDQADIIGDMYVSRRYCFDNVSAETLKNAVFALGGDGSYEELFAGEWELDFTVNYEETMKTWAFDGGIQAEELNVKKISISPVSAEVEFDTLSDKMEPVEQAALILKDGSRIESQAIRAEMEGETAGKCRILWESVADTEEIDGISLNDSVISL